ncbi:MAG: hypothetical protein KDD47_09310 [Acidobacteria bacterium]|nr:hypothetical protein [Acidobacteriota bacterium]
MKTFPLKSTAFAFAASLLLLAAAGPASAADFPERQALEARSVESGLGIDRIPLLQRLAGPGRETVAEQALARFAQAVGGVTTAGGSRLDLDEKRHGVIGDDGWFLTVYADGSRIHYDNYTFLESRPELALPLEQRLSQEVLEALGRSFVTGELQGFVSLGSGERLVPSFTEFLVQGGSSTEPGGPVEEDTVLASTIVFSRTVNGVAIVGPGSKIAVTFANDGTAVAFDVDWARYQPTGELQDVLPVAKILERSAALRDGVGEENLEHMECGYFDLGGRKRDVEAPLQAGCFLQVSVETPIEDGHLLAAYAEAVPAGVSVEADPSWPEAARLAGLPIPPGAPEPPAAPASKG